MVKSWKNHQPNLLNRNFMNCLLPSKIVHWSSGPPGLCCKSLQVQLEVGNSYEHPWLPHRLIMNSHCARSISILFRKNTDNNTTVHYDVFSRVSLALCSSVFRDTHFVKKNVDGDPPFVACSDPIPPIPIFEVGTRSPRRRRRIAKSHPGEIGVFCCWKD